MMKYKEITINEVTFIQRTDSSGQVSVVPCDFGNSDYQEYLNKDKPKVEYLTEEPTSGE